MANRITGTGARAGTASVARGVGGRLKRNSLLAATALVSVASATTASANTYNASTYAELVTAINSANANAGGDTINVTANITLSGLLPVISDATAINGNTFSISGNNQYRLFFVDAGAAAVSFNAITLMDGRAQGGNGGVGGGGGGLGAGGAIFVNTGAVTATDVSFGGNAAQGGNGTALAANGGGGGGGGGGLGGGGGAVGNSGGGGGGYSGGGGGGGSQLYNGAPNGGPAGAGGAGPDGAGGAGSASGAGQAGTNGGAGGAAFTSGSFVYGGGGGGGGVNGGTGGNRQGGGGGGAGYTGAGGTGGSNNADGTSGGTGGGGGGSAGAGVGGNGGDFGGGGGGYYAYNGGNGGFGGGGAGGYGYSTNGNGGNGGFGGGGGAGGGAVVGTGGTGAGTGSSSMGGGGAGLGGAVFVRNGGSFAIAGSTNFTGGVATRRNPRRINCFRVGAGGALFLQGGQTLIVSVGAGQTTTIANSLADDSAASLAGGTYTAGTGVGANLTKTGTGTLVLNSTNIIGGTTTISAGTLQGTTAAISGASIVDNSALVYGQTGSGTVAQAISGSGTVTVMGLAAGNTLTFNGALTNTGGLTANGSSVTINAGAAGGILENGAGNRTLTIAGGAATNATSNTSGSGLYVQTTSGITTVNVNTGAMLTTTATTGNRDGITALTTIAITNNGTISSSFNAGVALAGGGSINNFATIAGGNGTNGYGIAVSNAAPATVTLQSGSAVTGTQGGIAFQSTGTGAASATLSNAGQVSSARYGIEAVGPGTPVLTNLATSKIVGGQGAIAAAGATTISNSGTIGIGTIDGGGNYVFGGTGYAVMLGATSTVTNSGTIRGGGAGIFASGGLNLVNTGNIYGGQGFAANTQDAVYAAGSVTILNAGSITTTQRIGTGGAPTYAALNLVGGGTATNAAGGLLAGGTDANNGDAIQFFAAGTFNNYGTATGSGAGALKQFSSAVTTINLFAGSTTGAITTNNGNDMLAIYSGRGTNGTATVDAPSGITLQNAGTLAAATVGAINLGGGTNAVQLRGTGDGQATNGAAGSFVLTGNVGLSTLAKLDSGTWTITGNATGNSLAQINAGTGTPAGVLIFNNTSNLTSAINVNGAIIRATSAGAFGTGTITTIDPTIQYGATGTYTNPIVLASANPAGDPTILQTFGTGITATLSGLISQPGATAQPLVFSSVDANSAPNTGTFQLTNANNNYAGLTSIGGGTTVVEVNTGSALGSGGVTIASGGVLQFDNQTGGQVFLEGGTYGGAGTLRFTGNAGSTTVIGFPGNVMISLASGGLVDVVSGTVSGSSNNQGFWTGNKGDLAIAAGAVFNGVEGVIIVDALSGAGTLRGGFGAVGSTTVGVDNGSGTFTGIIADNVSGSSPLVFTKTGTGTQTLTGANTYTGATTISGGTLALTGAGSIANSAVTDNATLEIKGVAGATSIGSLAGTGTVLLGANTLTAGSNNQSTTFSGVIGGTVGAEAYVGRWLVSDGPRYTTNPTVYSGQDAAALLFGGVAADYQISTIGTDPTQINRKTYLDGWGDQQYLTTPAADSFSVDTGAAGYNMPGGPGSSYSAYVNDHTTGAAGKFNYAFRLTQVTATGGFTKAGTGTLILTGANSYTGLTTISDGILQGTTTSISGGSVVDNATLAYVQAASGTEAKAISGTGVVTVSGLGAANAVTFAGALTNAGGLTLGTAGNATISGSVSNGSTTGAVMVTGLGDVLSITSTGSVTSTQSANGDFASAVYGTAPAFTVTNAGTINAPGDVGATFGSNGIYAANSVTVNNTGKIYGIPQGSTATYRSDGIIAFGASTVNNTGAMLVGGVLTGSTAGGGTITGGWDGVYLPIGGGTVFNSGTITGNLYNGIEAATNVTNFAGGQIVGGSTGVGVVAGGSVTNSGMISGAGYVGVGFNGAGTLLNGASGNTPMQNASAVITGGTGVIAATTLAATNYGRVTGTNTATAGVNVSGAGSVLTNYGTVEGGAQAIVLNVGGTINNYGAASVLRTTNATDNLNDSSTVYSDGDLMLTNEGAINAVGVSGSSYGVEVTSNGASTLNNSGTITAGAAGIFLGGVGTVTNSGAITGGTSAFLAGGGTLTNSGTLTANVDGGAELGGTSQTSTVANNAGGLIQGVNQNSGYGLIVDNGSWAVSNAATATITGGNSGILSRFGAGLVTDNSGLIEGKSQSGYPNGYGILATGTGAAYDATANGSFVDANGNPYTAVIVNRVGGQIVGAYTGIETQRNASITNSGTVGSGSVTGGTYTASGQDGIRLLGGGTITNTANALIQSVGGSGVYVEGASGTVINSGTIQSANGVFTFGGNGLDLSVTNNSGGLVYATNGVGVYQGGPGALTVTNNVGGTIVATAADAVHDDGFGLTTIVNDGTIVGQASGLATNGAIDITNTGLIGAGTLAGGTSGAFTANGLYVGVSTNSGGTVVNSGTIQGGSGDGGINSDGRWGLYSSNGALTVTNTGTIATAATGLYDGITALNGALTVTNTGVRNGMGVLTGGIISAATASGIAFTGAGGSIINSGSITGGSDPTYGYGVQVSGGDGTITNASGGTIAGGTGSILLASDNAVTLDLQYQSTTTGQILSNGAGGRTVLIGGALAGDYNGGSGTGVVNWTLGALGSMQAATFGNADDSFLFNGGTIDGVVDAGDGTDAFTSDIGMGNSATLNLSNVVNFEALASQSGDLTVTGTGSTAVQLNGGTFTVEGTLNAPITAASGTAIGVTANGSIVTTNAAAIYTPGGGTLSIVNAGTINSTGSDTFVGGGAITLLNTGTISTDLFQAASGGANSAYTNSYSGHLLGGTDATYGIGANVGDNGTLANYGEIAGGATLANGLGSLSGGTNAQVDLFAGSTTGTVALGTGSTLSIYNGTGTGFAGVNVNGVQLQQAGSNAGAITGAITLGTASTLQLRGTGDGTAANGDAGSFAVTSLVNVETLTKLDTGTWTLTGTSAPSLTQINVGTGGAGTGGLLVFDGTTGLTAAIAVNGGTIRAASDGAFGSGTITAIDPTIQYGATGTYANNIVLASADTANDPTQLLADNGVNATLTGTISEATAAQPLVINATNSTGTITLAGANTYTGATTVAGGTLAVNGSTISATTVSSGAILTGAGAVGATTIADGGILLGTQGSTLTMASLGLSSGSIINATFSAPGGAALFAATGNITLDGTVNVASTGAFGFGVYRLLSYGGALTDNGLVVGTAPIDAQRTTVQTSVAGQVNIVSSSTDLQFWDGGNPALYNNGAVNGGSGIWSATSPTFTDANGLFNGPMSPQPGFAIFQAASGTVTVDGSAGAIAVTGLQFASNGYIVTGDPIGLANPTTAIRVGDGTAAGAAFTATISSALTGANALDKTDLGALVLSGANTYTGLTTISGGTLALSGGEAIADGNTVLVNAGGTLALKGNERIATLNGAGAVSLGANTLSLGTNNASSNFSGVASGTGGISQTGTGTLTLSGTNTYTGTTTINGGTLTIGASNVLADSSTLFVQNGVVNLGANTDTIDHFLLIGGTLNGTGTLSSTSMSGLQGYTLANATIYANLGMGSLGTAAGNTNTILNGASAAGLISVSTGTLTLGASNRLADNAAVMVNTGGALAIVGFTDTVGSLNLAGTLAGTGTLTAATYALNGATVNANLGAGALSNTGGVSVLMGTSAAGTVAVAGGTLRLGAAERLSNSAVLNIDANGVLDLAGFQETVGSASIAGMLSGTGTLTAATYALNGATIDGNLGAGALSNVTGTSVLNGTSTAGTVAVTGGTLRLGAAERLANNAVLNIDANGVLDLAGFQETVGSASIAGTLNGTGTLTAATYALAGATVNANLGAGALTSTGITALNGTAGAGTVGVTGGTLSLGASNRLADTAAVTVATGATLNLNAFTDTVGSLALNGTLAGTGTLSAATYALNGAIVNANTGGGALTSTGTTVLNGTAGAGTVAVNGGTLSLGAANRLADTAAVTVASGTTLNLNAFSDTVGTAALSGTLAGIGTLTAATYTLSGAAVNANLGGGALTQTAGTSVLSGTSAAATVAVTGGTLRLGANERLLDMAAVSVAAGATFDLAGFTETVATVSGTGTLALGAGRLAIGGTNADVTYNGAITGSGDLDKNGTGSLTLAGNYAATGRFNLNGGTTLFTGNTAGSIRVQGATLRGTGTAGGNLLLASGTLAPGAAAGSIGTLTAASLTVNGGTFAVDFGGAANAFAADMLRVSGAAVLSGGTVSVNALEAPSGYRTSQTYTIVQAGSLSGTFANGAAFSQVNPSSAELYWRLRYDLVPSSVVLEVRKIVDFTQMLGTGATPNQIAVAGGLNGGAISASDNWAAILNNIGQQTVVQRLATLDSIGGESNADVTTSVAGVSDVFTDILRQRLSFGSGESGDTSLVTGLLDKRGAMENLRASGAINPQASSLAGTGEKRGGAWIQGIASNGRLDGNRGQASLNNFYSGVAAGVDGRIGVLTIGAAVATTHIESTIAQRTSKNEGTLHQAGGYLAYDNGRSYASVIGSYFEGDIDTERQVFLGGTFAGRAVGNADTTGYTIGGQIGHRFKLDDTMRFTVQASGGKTQVTRQAFTETGAGALSLSVGREQRNLYTAQVEGRLSTLIKAGKNGGTIEPYAGAGVRFNFGDLATLSANRFTGAPTGSGAFVINGARLSDTANLFSGGVEIHPNDATTFGIGVDTTLANREREGRVSANMRIRF